MLHLQQGYTEQAILILRLDIAFIAEGYTRGEMEKFRADVKRMADILFQEAPFDKYQDRINIWAVEAPSQESGDRCSGRRDLCEHRAQLKLLHLRC